MIPTTSQPPGADILPLKRYQHLFLVETPAGIINERKGFFVDSDERGKHRVPKHVDIRGRWVWHDVCRDVGHGSAIPPAITDRVEADGTNMGVNTALLVLEPSIDEYAQILEELADREIAQLVSSLFGAHFAGIKPWDLKRWDSVTRYSRYQDFQYWCATAE
jgi:hypothetical protein